MSQRGPDTTPLVVLGVGVTILLWAYLRENPQCDRGCQNRLDHLLLHVLPLLLNRGLGPTDLIG